MVKFVTLIGYFLSSLVSTCTLSSQLLRRCDSSTVQHTAATHSLYPGNNISEDISAWWHARTNVNHRPFCDGNFVGLLGKRRWLPSSGRDQTLEIFTQIGKMCGGQEDSKYGRIFKCKYTKLKQIKKTLAISHYMQSFLEKHCKIWVYFYHKYLRFTLLVFILTHVRPGVNG